MIAAYSEESDTFTFMDGMDLLWEGDEPPIDAPLMTHKIMIINKYLLLSLYCLASIGVIFSLLMLTFNIVYHNHP